MINTTTRAAAKASRSHDLKTFLESRRRELVHDVQDRIRAARSDRSNDREVLDVAESSEVDNQLDISFALMQLKAETLNRIDAALRRLQEGSYGECFECGNEIADARLRALPFAVRCRDCEERREEEADAGVRRHALEMRDNT